MTPQELKELLEFYENTKLMRKHYHSGKRDKCSHDLEISSKYAKKVDDYIRMREKEQRSKQKLIF